MLLIYLTSTAADIVAPAKGICKYRLLLLPAKETASGANRRDRRFNDDMHLMFPRTPTTTACPTKLSTPNRASPSTTTTDIKYILPSINPIAEQQIASGDNDLCAVQQSTCSTHAIIYIFHSRKNNDTLLCVAVHRMCLCVS